MKTISMILALCAIFVIGCAPKWESGTVTGVETKPNNEWEISIDTDGDGVGDWECTASSELKMGATVSRSEVSGCTSE